MFDLININTYYLKLINIFKTIKELQEIISIRFNVSNLL